jgi:hypothetical protein
MTKPADVSVDQVTVIAELNVAEYVAVGQLTAAAEITDWNAKALVEQVTVTAEMCPAPVTTKIAAMPVSVVQGSLPPHIAAFMVSTIQTVV